MIWKKHSCGVTLHNLISLLEMWCSALCVGSFQIWERKVLLFECCNSCSQWQFHGRQWACHRQGNSKGKDVRNLKAWGSISPCLVTCFCMLQTPFLNWQTFFSLRKFLIHFCHLICLEVSGNIAEWSGTESNLGTNHQHLHSSDTWLISVLALAAQESGVSIWHLALFYFPRSLWFCFWWSRVWWKKNPTNQPEHP